MLFRSAELVAMSCLHFHESHHPVTLDHHVYVATPGLEPARDNPPSPLLKPPGGDPLAQLEYSAAVHTHALRRLRALAARHADGRLLAFGGGLGELMPSCAQCHGVSGAGDSSGAAPSHG